MNRIIELESQNIFNFFNHRCDKLYEDLFSDCHHVVDPEMFHKNCLYNGCFANQVDCWDFEAYVTECAANGVCMDWREDDFCRKFLKVFSR